LQTEPPMSQAVQTSIIPSREDVDPDIFATMTSLQCFRNEEKLYDALLSPYHNTEKVIYFLLLDRKIRSPCYEDPDEIKTRSSTVGMCPIKDPPRKRIDSLRLGINGTVRLSLGDLSEGSPLAGRRGLAVQKLRKQSASTNLDIRSSTPVSPISSPIGYYRGHYRMSGYEACSPIEEITDQYRKHTISSPIRSQAEVPLIMRKHPNVHQGQILSPRNQYRFSQMRHTSLRTPTDLISPPADRKSLNQTPSSPTPSSADPEVAQMTSSPQSPSLIPRPAVCAESSKETTPKRTDARKTEQKKSASNGSSKENANANGSEIQSSESSSTSSTTVNKSGSTSNTSVSVAASPLSPNHWRARLNSLRINFLGSPRFHRKKTTVPHTPPESPVEYSSRISLKNSARRGSNATPEPSPLLSNKSWFEGLLPLSLHNGSSKAHNRNKNYNGSASGIKVPATPHTGRHIFRGGQKTPVVSPQLSALKQPSTPLSPTRSSHQPNTPQQVRVNRSLIAPRKPIGTYQKSGIPLPITSAMQSGTYTREYALSPEETNHVAMVKGRPFIKVKSEITQVLLSTPGVVHTMLSPTCFRAEYRRAGSGSSLLARPVKIQIDIVRASTGQAAISNGTPSDGTTDRELYAVSFQLLSGPTRRFKRLCEQLQAPLIAGTGSQNSSSRLRSSPVPTMKLRSLDNVTSRNGESKPFDSTGIILAPLANANDESSQWSFVDTECTGENAASSISTLCSQFEASLAANDEKMESVLSNDTETVKTTTTESS
uniref:non-specific serine/threonine protein kinase n=4 Tax=Hymenolepis diminuta TaxID=6216 RepID=A0A158QD19_HYMDI